MHPLTSGRELYLAGLLWPGEAGLDGHSDGDVAAHAACTALLSAAGLGDLGANFGTSRPEWAGASGISLLRETFRLITQAGFVVGFPSGFTPYIRNIVEKDRQPIRARIRGDFEIQVEPPPLEVTMNKSDRHPFGHRSTVVPLDISAKIAGPYIPNTST